MANFGAYLHKTAATGNWAKAIQTITCDDKTSIYKDIIRIQLTVGHEGPNVSQCRFKQAQFDHSSLASGEFFECVL